MGETTKVRDPVCGMEVDPETAPVSLQWEGQTYYFCCEHCLRRFLQDKEAGEVGR